jgi:hypothetical protein
MRFAIEFSYTSVKHAGVHFCTARLRTFRPYTTSGMFADEHALFELGRTSAKSGS